MPLASLIWPSFEPAKAPASAPGMLARMKPSPAPEAPPTHCGEEEGGEKGVSGNGGAVGEGEMVAHLPNGRDAVHLWAEHLLEDVAEDAVCCAYMRSKGQQLIVNADYPPAHTHPAAAHSPSSPHQIHPFPTRRSLRYSPPFSPHYHSPPPPQQTHS